MEKKLIVFLLYWTLYSGVFHSFVYWTEALNIVPDVILLILFMKRRKHKERLPLTFVLNKFIPILCCMFLLLGTFSMLMNGFWILAYVWNIRFYLRAILLFVIIWDISCISDLYRYKRIMYQAYIPNLLFCFYYFFTGQGGDSLGGIFAGGNMEMVIYLMPVLFLAIADYYSRLIPLRKFAFIVFSSLLMSFMGEIKLLYIVIPLFCYAGYVLYRKFSVSHILALVFAFLLFVPMMKYMLSYFFSDEYVESVFTVEQTEAYTAEGSFVLGQENGMNRSTSLKKTEQLILTDSSHRLFGYGIGASSSSLVFFSPIGTGFRNTFFFLFTPSYLTVEVGKVGWWIFIGIYILLFITFAKFYITNKNKVIKYWAGIGILASLMTFILMWYNNTPILVYVLFYYLFAYCIVAIREELKIKNKHDKCINNRSVL